MSVIIDNFKDLNSIIKIIQDEDFLAIDTEFIRETTYFSKLCLIQIATKNISFIIDPLSNNITLEPLWEILNKKQIIKVMHSGRQDMEIFYNETGISYQVVNLIHELIKKIMYYNNTISGIKIFPGNGIAVRFNDKLYSVLAKKIMLKMKN